MIQKHISVLVLLFFLSLITPASSAEKKMIFGGDTGWPTFSRSQNITKTEGRFGKEALSVAAAAAALQSDTDLLLNFEAADFDDRAGNYKVVSSFLDCSADTIMGKYAGLGKGVSGGLTLKGGPQSIFGRTGSMGSFTVSFWLNPFLAENGEKVFSWRSSRNVDGVPVYQMISAAFFNNKMEWNFTNVFAASNALKTVTLSAKNLAIPGTWTFHSLSFDEETGLLEYCINGKTEDLLYTTSSSRSTGTVFLPVLGVPAEIELCTAFAGKIDDFCIRKAAVRFGYRQNRFNTDGAYFETKPAGPFPSGTSVTGIDALMNTPKETDIQFFIRAGDNYHTWTDSFPEWIPARPGERIKNADGMWFQVAAALYTDGAGEKAPSLTELTILYEEKDPPLPPVQVFAKAGDGYVDLSWLASAGSTVSGYNVYYGESPGEYLGQIAHEGRSPIDAGQTLSLRLTGLKNGKIYYFALAAYENSDPKLEGTLSAEVYARPLRGKP